MGSLRRTHRFRETSPAAPQAMSGLLLDQKYHRHPILKRNIKREHYSVSDNEMHVFVASCYKAL